MEDATIEEKEKWLNSLIQNNDERLDTHAYLVVLKDLAKSNQSGSPHRAEDWMRKLEAAAATHPKLQPTVECYNNVIQSWANSGDDASISVVRAERWLSKLGNNANTESYNAFLDSCSRGRGGRRSYATAQKRAIQAKETLDYMIRQYKELGSDSPVIPNTESFNHVIRALTRCRHDPTVAHQVMIILKQMTEYQKKDPENSPIKPNTKSYTMTLDAFSITARRKASNCLDRLKKGSDEDFQDATTNGLQEIQTMQDLLAYMHKLHESGGLDYAMPNTVTYNVLISAWARVSGPIHPNAPLEAEKVLRKMIALREDFHFAVAPDVGSYTKVILAWTNLGRDTAGKRAQWWLKQLYEEYEVANDDRLRPTVGAYNAVIMAWSKVGRPENAEMLLVDLILNEKSEKIPCLKANSESFALVIHAWLKIDANESADSTQLGERFRRAAKWLDKLIWLEENGDNVTSTPELFDNVLKAATKCKNPEPDILDFSISILDRYRASRHRVDTYAYVYLLQTGLNTLGTCEYNDTRFAFLEQLFRDCCDDGLLSNAFVRELANGPVYYDGWTQGESAKVVKEFFSDWPLPREWSRNLNHDYHVPTIKDTKRTHREIRLRDRPERFTA